jgi:hypothetical protein
MKFVKPQAVLHFGRHFGNVKLGHYSLLATNTLAYCRSETFWSKFVHTFRKLDRFIDMNAIANINKTLKFTNCKRGIKIFTESALGKTNQEFMLVTREY